MKEWAKKEVAIAHGYLQDFEANVSILHSGIAECVHGLTKSITKPRIADLGCGNGRWFYALKKLSDRFYCDGYDINESCLDFANSYFDSATTRFFYSDLDNLEEMKQVKGYDCVLMDSTINMVEKPKELLDLLIEQNDIVFLARVRLGNTTEKQEYQWGGMMNSSPNWLFDKNFYINLAKKHETSFEYRTIAENSCLIFKKERRESAVVTEEKYNG